MTSEETLAVGLELAGFDERRRKKVRIAKNLSRFHAHFGSGPRVYATLWEMLHATGNETASIMPFILKLTAATCFQYYLMAIHLLCCYPTEDQAEGVFAKPIGVCDKMWSHWSWKIIELIHNLHTEVILWPGNWGNPDSDSDDETIFIITVDGVHCEIEEPTLDSFSDIEKHYSHKFNEPALDYEIGISIFTQKCVWINGP